MEIYHCKTQLEYESVIYYLCKIKKYKIPRISFNAYKENTCIIDFQDGYVFIVDMNTVKKSGLIECLIQFRPPVSIAALIKVRGDSNGSV